MSAIARLVCVPNGCPSRSATMSIFGGPRRARQQMSRGASSCIVKMIVLAAGVMDMGADRPRCALMFAYGFDIWCRWVRIWCVCVAARPLDRVLSESWCRRLLGCRVPGRGSCTVCRARGDDQPVLIETTVSATQSATQVHSVHCQPAVTSGESVSLRWRQVGRLRVGELAPRMTFPASSRACHMQKSSNIQDVGGSGAIRRMQLNGCQLALCRWATATATIYLELCSTYTSPRPVSLLPSPT
jgi:hypothetical protein